MKIVDLNTFLALPAGTVYFNYVEHNFDLGGAPALMIKGATLGDGFYEATCASTDTRLDVLIMMSKAAKSGKSFLLKPQPEKFDGGFRDEQLYAVYEAEDAKQLVTRLLKAFGASGLMEPNMTSMIDQVINVTGRPPLYEAEVFKTPPSEPLFECTNLHTGEKHKLTQDQVGELLETGVAPTPPINKE